MEGRLGQGGRNNAASASNPQALKTRFQPGGGWGEQVRQAQSSGQMGLLAALLLATGEGLKGLSSSLRLAVTLAAGVLASLPAAAFGRLNGGPGRQGYPR